MDLGYARVSTAKQDLSRQLDALTDVGIPDNAIYVDRRTGANTHRAGLQELLAYARTGDRIVCYTLDRLGRNLREMLTMVHELRERGIYVRTLADPIPIDTADNSPMGQIAVAMLGLVGECQRVWTAEAAAHARSVAAKSGKPVGRKPALDADSLRAAQAALDNGMSVAKIVELFGVSRATVYRRLRVPPVREPDTSGPLAPAQPRPTNRGAENSQSA